MDKLITSSSKTLGWLNKIRSEIEQRCPDLEYKDGKYYASFRSYRNIAQLHPQKNKLEFS